MDVFRRALLSAFVLLASGGLMVGCTIHCHCEAPPPKEGPEGARPQALMVVDPCTTAACDTDAARFCQAKNMAGYGQCTTSNRCAIYCK